MKTILHYLLILLCAAFLLNPVAGGDDDTDASSLPFYSIGPKNIMLLSVSDERAPISVQPAVQS